MWPVSGLEAEEAETTGRPHIECFIPQLYPEDWQSNCPKYVELIRIINKQLL
jgi:hypothetical protein